MLTTEAKIKAIENVISYLDVEKEYADYMSNASFDERDNDTLEEMHDDDEFDQIHALAVLLNQPHIFTDMSVLVMMLKELKELDE